MYKTVVVRNGRTAAEWLLKSQTSISVPRRRRRQQRRTEDCNTIRCGPPTDSADLSATQAAFRPLRLRPQPCNIISCSHRLTARAPTATTMPPAKPVLLPRLSLRNAKTPKCLSYLLSTSAADRTTQASRYRPPTQSSRIVCTADWLLYCSLHYFTSNYQRVKSTACSNTPYAMV